MFNEWLEIRWKTGHFCILKFLLLKLFFLRSNMIIKHSTQCFITRWITSKFVKNTPLRVAFLTLFTVFHLVVKHCVSCLIITWFSVISGFIHKTVHLFRNFLTALPHSTQNKDETRKNSGLNGGVRHRYVNWKTPQKCLSAPRLLSMIVHIAYSIRLRHLSKKKIYFIPLISDHVMESC